MSTKEILELAKNNFAHSKYPFFDSVQEINSYVKNLAALLGDALTLDKRNIALTHPSFYAELLDIIHFRIPVHSRIDLLGLSKLRSSMVIRDLARYMIESNFQNLKSTDSRFRYGLLVKQLTFDPETRAIFGYLPDVYQKDIEPYIFVVNRFVDSKFQDEVSATGAKVVFLPQALSDVVKTLRHYSLDYLHFTNDITAKYTLSAKIPFFKVASKMGAGVSSIMPIAFSKLDTFLAGDYFLDNCDHDEYPIRLLSGKHPGYAFRGTETLASGRRAKDSVTKEAKTIFISGSNFWKINGEVIRLWGAVMREVPNSLIKLSLFPPHYTAGDSQIILNRIAQIFEECGVSKSRVILLEPSKSLGDWHRELQMSHIYLDSFPYSSLTSIHDALQCGLPTVVMKGPLLRNQHAPAILHQMKLDTLIAKDSQEYIRLCVELAVDPEKHTRLRSVITSNFNLLTDVRGFFSSFIKAVK